MIWLELKLGLQPGEQTKRPQIETDRMIRLHEVGFFGDETDDDIILTYENKI